MVSPCFSSQDGASLTKEHPLVCFLHVSNNRTSCPAITAQRKEEDSLLRRLSAEATARRTKALLPRKWLDIVI